MSDIRTGIIMLSQVADHPNQSLVPSDYLADRDDILRMLLDNTPNSRAKLQWLLVHDLIGLDTLTSVAMGYILEKMTTLNDKAEEFENTILDLRAAAIKARLEEDE